MKRILLACIAALAFPAAAQDWPAKTVRIIVPFPAGGSAVVEFRAETPGKLVLVDHALFRAFHKGTVGLMMVEGEPQANAFGGQVSTGPYTPAPAGR